MTVVEFAIWANCIIRVMMLTWQILDLWFEQIELLEVRY